MDEITLELDCSICGQNAEFHTTEPVQWQAFFDAWGTAHRHTQSERNEYYRAEWQVATDEPE